MVSHPSSDLFGAPEAAPTTRDIARLVKAGGLAALPDATARADHATYQETRCKSALNRVQGMPFRWTLNPYAVSTGAGGTGVVPLAATSAAGPVARPRARAAARSTRRAARCAG